MDGLAPIENRIYHIRGQSVMLDRDLAALYGVPTKVLKQAVKRNIERFPPDFMFELGLDEFRNLRSQFVTSSFDLSDATLGSRSQFVTLNDENGSTQPSTRSQFVTLKQGRNIKYQPYAFTEHGVAMLSSVLNSDRAIQVNIQIMRSFVRLRQMVTSHDDLRLKLESLEQRYDEQFKIVFDAMRQLLAEDEEPKTEIGFKAG